MFALRNVINLEKLTRKHRAVDPIIAMLLLVATTVVGGIVIFEFSQGFFSQGQISGTPTIELIKILGYDARDVTELNAHDGNVMPVGTAGDPATLGKVVDERVAVYVKNDSVNPILFTEVRLGGTVYAYSTAAILAAFDAATSPIPGEYVVLTDSTNILQEQAAVIEPGQTITILIDLADGFPIGRDAQFKLTTTSGAIFVDTVVVGHNSFSFFGSI